MGAPLGSQGILPFGGPYLILSPGKVHFGIKAMVVLDGAKYPEGFIVVKLHVIELSQRKLLDEVSPVLTFVVRDRDAAVVGSKDVIGIIRIDPHAMLIHMYLSPIGFECSPSIGGDIDPEPQGIDAVLVIGVHAHLGKYPSVGARVP